MTGGLTYNFKQYDATYGVTTVLGTGNGFLYTLAPVITPSLTGTVTKNYDATTTATLASNNYIANGEVGGDIVTLTSAFANYASPNVGNNINVTATGISIFTAKNGSAIVYGYGINPTTANANIGKINAASLTVSSDAGQTKVYGTNDPSSAATAYYVSSGTLYGSDTITGSMGRVAGENVGSYAFTQNTVNISDGNGGNNYNLTFNGTTNPFQITSRPLTASILNQSKTYGTNDPAITGIAVALGNVVDGNVTDINGNVTFINDTTNVSTSLASLTRNAGETVALSPYNITAATFNPLSGSAASNYTGPTGLTGSPILTITQASLSGALTTPGQSKLYGTNDPSITGIGVTLSGLVDTTVTNWMGNTTPINDTGITTSLATLTRVAGENVGSYNVTAATFNALSGSGSGNYSTPAFSTSNNPSLTITAVNLSAELAVPGQSKTYGMNDPAISGVGVSLNGLVDTTVTNWMGNTTPINDTGITTSYASLTRVAGENIGSYNVTAATINPLSGTDSGNYNAPVFSTSNNPSLTILAANLSGALTVPAQTKVYGTNDPALSGIGVTLTGLVDTTVTNWMGNTTAINDTGITTSLATLTRVVGETVGNYNVTAATFNSLSGSGSGNYNVPTFSMSNNPALSITQANLTATIANQTKVYGTDDPSISGISALLSGVVDTTVTNWMGNTTPINDTGNVTGTLSSLTRVAGETVSGGPYAITSAGFILSGSAASNYNSTATFTGTPTLTITPASLTGTFVDQTKVYGSDDPAPASINVLLGGVIDNSNISTWNGPVSIDDTGNVATTLATVTRVAGENVNTSPYTYTSATYNALTGSAAGNYFAPTGLSGSPVLSVIPATLTYVPNATSRTYGSANPTFSGTVTGFVLGQTIATATTGTLTFTSPALVTSNVGNYPIIGSGLTANFGNYTFTQGSGFATALAINPASLTAAGVLAKNKVYNGNTVASLNLNSATLNGVLFSDQVSINPGGYSANFISPNIGNNIPVTVMNLGLSGASASDYTLIQPTGLVANIIAGGAVPSPGVPYGAVFPINSAASSGQGMRSTTLINQLMSDLFDIEIGSAQNPYKINNNCVNVGPSMYICGYGD